MTLAQDYIVVLGTVNCINYLKATYTYCENYSSNTLTPPNKEKLKKGEYTSIVQNL
jgi:hypothetical protein